MPVIFYPNTPFGKLELLSSDGSVDLEIPLELTDRREVLDALQVLARSGGSAVLRRAPEWHCAVVDPGAGTVSYELGEEP